MTAGFIGIRGMQLYQVNTGTARVHSLIFFMVTLLSTYKLLGTTGMENLSLDYVTYSTSLEYKYLVEYSTCTVNYYSLGPIIHANYLYAVPPY